MAKKKNKKIVRYRRPLNINVGMIIFAIIFIYLAFSVFAYIKRDKIQFYEVVEGGIVNDRQYTGLILREEQVKTTSQAGYINYYLREGKRASVGSRIYSLDETGRLDELLKGDSEAGQTLSKESLSELKKQLSSFVLSISDQNFNVIYDARYTLENSVADYSSFSALDRLDELSQEAGVAFEQIRSDVAGIVSYSFDNYESMKPEDVEAASFDRTSYTKTSNKSGNRIDSGAPAYKIVTSENWSILFPLSEEDRTLYEGQTSLEITVNHSMRAVGNYSVITGKDGESYGKLDFNKYMEHFIRDRFVDFEIHLEKADGLKIPVSAATEKSFYLVPVDYISYGGDSTDTGFLKEVYNENGTSAVFVPTTIYYNDGENYYIEIEQQTEEDDTLKLRGGDYLVRPESSERYQLGSTAPLKGVYNINKGYTVFKQIEILDSNSEYYIVRKNMDYGLSVYDHIVLDASLVEEGMTLYQ